ncbi:MAG: phage tail assembly chaperone [Filomicrobium sp.]
MAAGLGILGLSPDVFWQTTPKELAAALRAKLGDQGSGGVPARNDLMRLMQRFPDEV